VWTAVVLTAAINAGDPRALPWYVAAYIVSLYIPIVIARGAYEAVLQSRSSEGTSLWAEATRGFGTDAWHAIGMPEASYEGVLPSNRVKLLAVGAFVLEGWVFDAYAGLPNRLLSTGEQAAAGPLPFGAHLFLPLVGLAFFLLGARLLFWLGNRLRLSARRRLTRTAQELMLTDTRPPVLFLRSFADDQLSLQAAKIPWYMRVLDPGSQAETLEELITRNYSPIGPIVAIGRPGDDLPPLGAARQYVGDLEWKAAVADLMDAAALIVVGLGESDGLSWELSELVRRDHLARSIFIMPPGYAADRRLLRDVVTRLTNGEADWNDRSWQPIGNVTALAVAEEPRFLVSVGRASELDYEVALRLLKHRRFA